MRRIGFIWIIGIFLLLFVVPVSAQEISDIYTDSLSVDSFAIDSFDPDPEWYVAPVIPASLRAPMRTSAAAASCKTDSVLTFNVDSVLTDVTVYEYDEAGRTVGTLVWTCNTDGSRVGKSRTEDRYDASGTKTMTATYVWDNMTNDWKGNAKTEYEFANGKNTVTTVFDWLNGAWSAKTKYTYSYDAAGREVEYYEYSRNASLQLVYSKGRIREYNTNAKLIVEIQYSAHNGTDWSAGTKEVYDYDASGNQIEYTYYSSLSNGNWVGSTHEEWTYNAANKKTYYAKQTWKNGAWSNTSKEEYAYNAANKQTLKIVYTGSGTTWTGSTKEETDYNAAGQTILSAKYKWKNGEWTGNGQKTETTYSGNKQSVIIYSSWSTTDTDWIYASRRSFLYDNSGKVIADTTKSYTNSAWVNYALVTHAFDTYGNDTLSVTSGWNGENWAATSITKGKYLYTASGKPLLVETYMGLESSWTGKLKIEYAYNEAEEQTLYLSYDWYDGDWKYKLKNEKTYDAANHLLLNETYSWNNSQWVGSDKYEYAYDANGRQLMNTRYIWSNNAWKGISRTDKEFYSDGKEKTTISYTWSNDAWEGMFKYDYIYDQAGRTIERLISRFQNANWVEEQRYTYTFDARGQEIYSHEYRWVNGNWQMISAHEKTYDEADNKLRRDITGSWNTNGNVSSYTDMHYFYACDPHYYTIRFVNYDGAELSSESILEGQTPSFSGTEPTKPQDTQYTYSFSGWTPSITSVSGNATYTATYSSTPRQYTITWLDEDGTEISHETLEYGVLPTHDDVTKQRTAEWTYSFIGWSPDITSVTGNATYTAQFNATKNSYKITWLDDDDSLIDETYVLYGIVPTHTAPTKEATDEHSYFFDKWTPDVVAVTGEATYKASYTETTKVYTITWLNENGTEISHETLEYGANPTHVDPIKQATDEFTYTFAGWNPAVTSVTGDASYTATFTATKNSYTITWKNDDGSIIESETLEYGTTPTHEDINKESTAEYTYTFAGWTPQITAVTGDAEYTATFMATKNSYTITWLNEDGSEIEHETLEYGATPSHADVTKESTAEYTYAFAGWTPQVVAVTGDASYTATFSSTANTYTITWKDENGVTLNQTTVTAGTLPAHNDPTKQNTAEYTYAFTGWSPEVVAAVADATYQATFSQTKNSYTITWLNDDDTQIDQTSVEYGVVPTHDDPTKQPTAQYGYTFAGWSPAISAVTGNATYKATYTDTINQYTISWLDDVGTLVDQTKVAYGATPAHANIYKESDDQFDYTFVGWTPTLVPVTGDASYSAIFTTAGKSYTVTFYFEDGVTVLDQMTLPYGAIPSTPYIPSIPSDANHTYTFSGWSPEIAPVTGDISYVPTFTAIPNQYTVIFRNYNGKELQRKKVDYGTIPAYEGDEPSRPATNSYTWAFEGWTPELVAVIGDATYTAVYTKVMNTYTILFYDEDGITLLDEVTVEHGQKPTTSVTPTKPDDEEYRYTFAGWSPKIVKATMDATYTATYTATPKTQGLGDVQRDDVQCTKVLLDGTIYIRRGGNTYSIDGQRVK